MVSVVIPTYNRSLLVREAIESVCAQRGVPFELIVVDDGSTDGTESVLEGLGGPVRCVSQVHRGVSAARNRGIAEAKGEWIAFLDSDDLWLPGKLAAQMDYLARNPAEKICQTEEMWLRDGKRVNPRKYHQKPEGFCFGSLLDRCMVSPSAVVIHRTVFGETGLFDESLPACEDYDMWLRIGCRYPVGLIGEVLVVKRGGHSDQLSATVPALDRYRIAALLKLLENDPLTQEQRRLAMEALKRKCAIYAQGCRRRGRAEEAEAVEHRVRALCESPLPTTCQAISPVENV